MAAIPDQYPPSPAGGPPIVQELFPAQPFHPDSIFHPNPPPTIRHSDDDRTPSPIRSSTPIPDDPDEFDNYNLRPRPADFLSTSTAPPTSYSRSPFPPPSKRTVRARRRKQLTENKSRTPRRVHRRMAAPRISTGHGQATTTCKHHFVLTDAAPRCGRRCSAMAAGAHASLLQERPHPSVTVPVPYYLLPPLRKGKPERTEVRVRLAEEAWDASVLPASMLMV